MAKTLKPTVSILRTLGERREPSLLLSHSDLVTLCKGKDPAVFLHKLSLTKALELKHLTLNNEIITLR